ncbi:sodium-proton antiporter [Rhodospirillaceae bacterium LM-1]|nr:sodium-proton antiporter [Rhodospirillaceae bacterium LM-1]
MKTIVHFLRQESAGGFFLAAAAALAMVWANSSWGGLYQELLALKISVAVGDYALSKTLLHWVNDGLMAVFFMLVGIEIKREVMAGELNDMRKATLPAFGALGGMAVPAAVYALFNWQSPQNLAGWAIPSATDIAFSLGVLSLLGTRVPVSLKVFLLALAVLDDLGAIVVIAIFYTTDLSTLSLALAGIGLVGLLALNRAGVRRIAPYVLVGAFMWVCVLKSGVHATLAGVAVGLILPRPSPSQEIEHSLHPWIVFGILPLFALANAGVPLSGVGLDALLHPVTLGTALGLFLGKQAGVVAFSWMAIKLRLGDVPTGATWMQFYGVAVLTGIGFTMSLFVGTLAFADDNHLNATRLGVLLGSFASALAGYLILRFAKSGRSQHLA